VNTEWHDLIEFAYDCGYADGQAAERHRIAEGHAELAECWKPVGRRAHEDRIAERVRLFEQLAAQNYARLGYASGYEYIGDVNVDISDKGAALPGLRVAA